jgi:hypothetical protein
VIIILFVLLALSLVSIPSDVSATTGSTSPQVVHVGVYVQDFNKFSVADGTIETSFYLTLRSETNVSFEDIEIVNGHVTSVDTILNRTNEKEYRINAELTADPDLRRFPFDRHVIRIEIEPKYLTEQEMVLAIDLTDTGIDSESDLPGWELAGSSSEIVNRTYIPGEVPYSRAVYGFGIERDGTSTILKFFLPIMLIIVVALASLMIKISSRLGLNASMFLAAVLIHWRIVDNIPVVAYATFLDLFMMITYATLVMVLVSGIIILKFTEAKDQDRIALVNTWSIRIIPSISLTLYCVLFISLLV